MVGELGPRVTFMSLSYILQTIVLIRFYTYNIHAFRDVSLTVHVFMPSVQWTW